MKMINTSLYPESLLPEEFDNYLSQGWYTMCQADLNIKKLIHGNPTINAKFDELKKDEEADGVE